MFDSIQVKASSNISEVKYDSSRCIARVMFKSGDQYDYYGVAASIIFAWQRAESIGRYFNIEIKQHENIFPCRKVVIV